MNQIKWQSLLNITLLLLVVSCTSKQTLLCYSGEKRPLAETAVLDISNSSVYVMGIDDNNRRYKAFTEHFLELLPGRHVITLNYKSWKGTSNQPKQLEFSVKAGQHYVVKARAGYRQWQAWIVDQADGSVIAGSPE